MFNLTRSLVFFDIESTGLNVIRDRIIQIALIKYSKHENEGIEKSYLINPGIPISEEAMSVHGITPDMLRNKPSFQQVAQEIFDFIGDSDLAGYNSDRFDVPMLMEEFGRVGLDFNLDNRKTIDVQKIFYKMEPRTLQAAYKYYCHQEMTDAHDALADVKATVAVLEGQIKMYEGVDYVDDKNNRIPSPIKNDVAALYNFTNETNKTIDVTQRLKYDLNGEIVFNFGKYIGKPVGKILYEDRQYYQWIQDKDFSIQVKKLTQKILKEYEQNLRDSSS
ncbi:MAG TPA: 3'-5' exonuclease [Saprospiraceae bacterium]|nr:3'-5' exonuclease [Saprospiraceae bacterium]HRX30122.1 3'-5' exonuclease [Saprospiraceae bacterium]